MLATPLQYSHTLLGVSSSFGSAISNNVACATYHILSPFICFHLTQQCTVSSLNVKRIRSRSIGTYSACRLFLPSMSQSSTYVGNTSIFGDKFHWDNHPHDILVAELRCLHTLHNNYTS